MTKPERISEYAAFHFTLTVAVLGFLGYIFTNKIPNSQSEHHDFPFRIIFTVMVAFIFLNFVSNLIEDFVNERTVQLGDDHLLITPIYRKAECVPLSEIAGISTYIGSRGKGSRFEAARVTLKSGQKFFFRFSSYERGKMNPDAERLQEAIRKFQPDFKINA
jgi:hypothetical protein